MKNVWKSDVARNERKIVCSKISQPSHVWLWNLREKMRMSQQEIPLKALIESKMLVLSHPSCHEFGSNVRTRIPKIINIGIWFGMTKFAQRLKRSIGKNGFFVVRKSHGIKAHGFALVRMVWSSTSVCRVVRFMRWGLSISWIGSQLTSNLVYCEWKWIERTQEEW